jgi:hypothetical protein
LRFTIDAGGVRNPLRAANARVGQLPSAICYLQSGKSALGEHARRQKSVERSSRSSRSGMKSRKVLMNNSKTKNKTMKKYITIKRFRFMQGYAKNLPLAAVAVAGLGIAVFCSAYTVPEGCTSSVTAYADLGSDCGTAAVSATCVGDDTYDTVVADDNGSGPNLPFTDDSGESCDTTDWGIDYYGDPTTISLVVGINKLTAVSGEWPRKSIFCKFIEGSLRVGFGFPC